MKYLLAATALGIMLCWAQALCAQVPILWGYHTRWSEDFQVVRDVRLIDTDGDGDLDMALSHGQENQFLDGWYADIIENQGTPMGPNFSSFPHIQGENFRNMEFIDIDGDGAVEVISEGAIHYFAGFEEQDVVSVGDLWESSTTVDLDGDGDLDIAAIEETRVVSYENLGDNTFGPAVVIKDNISEGELIASADMNLDGDVDLVGMWEDHLWWWANNGSGGFGGGNNIQNDPTQGLILLADMDGDGDPDICHGTTYRPNNIGSYGSPEPVPGGSYSKMRFKDVDGDGDQDIFAHSNTQIAWFENQGDDVFTSSEVLLNTGGFGVDMGDIDGDGTDEFVIANSGSVRIYRMVDGVYVPDSPLVGEDSGAGDMAVADLNGDGKDDLISVGVSVRWQSSNQINALVYDGGNYGQLEVRDVNADGHIDVIVVDPSGVGGWVANDGNGVFGDLEPLEGLTDTYYIHSADVDLDGDQDLICFTSTGIKWFRYTGSGFTTLQSITSENLGGSIHQVGDTNGDGYPDFFEVVDNHTIWGILSDGAGGWSPAAPMQTTADLIQTLHAVDFNMDGLDDLVYATYTGVYLQVPSGYIAMLAGTATGLDAENILTDLGPGSSSDWGSAANLYSGDLDLDGDPDLVLLFVGAGRMDHIQNAGDGTVQEYETDTWGTSAFNSHDDGALGDYNGDGLLDMYIRLGDWPYWIRNDSGQGCTDPAACNFDPESFLDDGSCCFGTCGCAQDNATNYDPDAECDDGSCIFTFTGFVFDDENEDGTFDPEAEVTMPFTQVTVNPGGVLMYTDDFGEFSIDLPDNQEFTFATQNHPVFPYVTTSNPRTINTSSSYWQTIPIRFGLGKDAPEFQVCIDFYPSTSGLCNAPHNYNLCYRNMGNIPIDGVLEVEYDPLYQGYVEVTPIDSVVGNKLYMSFTDLTPGQMYFYDVELISPTTDFIGDTLVSTARIYGYNNGLEVAYGEQVRTEIVTCAYDPNDKQAFPLGETEDHLLREDQTQEFVVRFQNTGNAPAQNIIIRDTLDVNFDLDSFEFVANSHSVQTTLNPETRELTFFFPEIMLPDSNCCEPESHGLVSYKIRPMPGLPAGTRLENTAYIFFDNNPPIVTNTTWTTMHICRDWLNLEATAEADCFGDELMITSDYDSSIAWPQTYLWTNEEGSTTYGTDLILDYEVEEPIDEVLSLIATNPLCTEQGWVSVDFVPLNLDGSCLGDLNCDAIVGTNDLILFLGEYACVGPECQYDLDGDLAILVDDLLLVLGAFGTTCE